MLTDIYQFMRFPFMFKFVYKLLFIACLHLCSIIIIIEDNIMNLVIGVYLRLFIYIKK